MKSPVHLRVTGLDLFRLHDQVHPRVATRISRVIGRRDPLRIFLRAPLERQEVVVAAATARIAAADGRSGLIDRAAAFLGVEEAADLAEDRIGLLPHHVLATPDRLGELAARRTERQAMMLGQPLHVPFVERNEGVGAAVSGALAAIIHEVRIPLSRCRL